MLRQALEAMWRLMDDLGWRTDDNRDLYALTLSAAQAGVAIMAIQISAQIASDRTDHLPR